jgi:hypothetical protein
MNIDFTLDTAGEYVSWMLTATTAMLIIACLVFALWAALTWRDARRGNDQNLLSPQPIPPQCDSTPTSTSTDDTRPPQAPT